MRGIIGLFLTDLALEPELGRLTAGMLAVMADRGPDSAGFAIYGDGTADTTKLTRRGPASTYQSTALRMGEALGAPPAVVRHDDHAVLRVPTGSEARARTKLARIAPQVRIVASGNAWSCSGVSVSRQKCRRDLICPE